VHFIEVKTRRAGGLTTPEEAITPRKFASLRRAAEAYMAQHRKGNYFCVKTQITSCIPSPAP